MKFSSRAVAVLCLPILLASHPAFSQNSSSENPSSENASSSPNLNLGSSRVYENLFAGAKSSFQLWDLAGLAAGALIDKRKPAQGLKFEAFKVDHEISESLARDDGRKSLGAVSPVYYPGLAATSRFAGMILLDVVNIHDYSAATYAKMFRFQQALYYTSVVTHFAKRNIERYRPDGSDTYSFFSGHTSAAFATSTFLFLETQDFINHLAESRNGQLPLMSPRGWKMMSFGLLYGWAGYVGFSRIHDRKHYLSDVIVGAGSGILISYLLYPHETKRENFQLGVQPVRGGLAMGLGIKF
jgi:membrane-associated phospholipid phosphatase